MTKYPMPIPMSILAILYLLGTQPSVSAEAQRKTIVVGSGPGGTGFLKRALQLSGPDEIFDWFEEGGHNVIVDYPADYATLEGSRHIKYIDQLDDPLLKVPRFSALGGGAVMNSGGPLTLLRSSDTRVQPAVEQHGPVFLADELQSPAVTDPTAERWITRYREAGYTTENSHFLTTRSEGLQVGYAATTFRDGKRTQVAKTLAVSNADRVRLHLETPVERVLFGETNQAVGVELKNGTKVDADRVVLAGGVFGTYELLVRSGIGSRKDLANARIPPVVVDETVGKNIGDDAGIYFLHGGLGGNVSQGNGASHGADIVASRGNEFSITHWGRILYETTVLATATQNSSAYDFLRLAAENASIIKIDMPATYNTSVSIRDDGSLLYDSRSSITSGKVCVHDLLFGILKRALPPPPIIENFASLFGATIATPNQQCSSGRLVSNFHYHGGSQGVTGKDFGVIGTQGLYISDASVTDGYSHGAPMTNVYMIGYAVAEAVYTTPVLHSGAPQHQYLIRASSLGFGIAALILM